MSQAKNAPPDCAVRFYLGHLPTYLVCTIWAMYGVHLFIELLKSPIQMVGDCPTFVEFGHTCSGADPGEGRQGPETLPVEMASSGAKVPMRQRICRTVIIRPTKGVMLHSYRHHIAF